MAQPLTTPPPAPGPRPARRPSGVVLVVDDEPSILVAIARLLERDGIEAITATSAAEGLEVLARAPVDLVLSDMCMPDMDGATFLGRVARQWPQTVRVMLTGFASLDSAVSAINDGGIYQYINKPWEDDALLLTIRNGLELRYLEQDRARLQALTEAQNAELRELNTDLERRVDERTRELGEANETLKKNYIATVRVFSAIIEMRAPAIAGHSKRVAELARGIAGQMGMASEDCQHLLFAALLHDIGKVGLPDSLLTRPVNVMTASDRARVSRHAVVGEGLLMGLGALQESARLIRHHHEHFNGQGFPDGLAGKAIPLGARILAVANEFDALQIGTMSTHRLSADEAGEYIRNNSGKHYDPAVVDAFFALREGTPPLQEQTGGRPLGVRDLAPGMVLARDLVTRDQLLLLSGGFTLDERLINKLRKFEQTLEETFEVWIREEDEDTDVARLG